MKKRIKKFGNERKSKGGYLLNKNGMPLDRKGHNVLKTMLYDWRNW